LAASVAPVNSMVVGLLPHDPPDTVARMASLLLVVPSDGMRSNQQSSLFLVP